MPSFFSPDKVAVFSHELFSQKVSSYNFEKNLNAALGSNHLHLVHRSRTMVLFKQYLFAFIDKIIKEI